MNQTKTPVNVAIFQPVIPGYRVPFFTALNRKPEFNVEIFASMSAYGSPDTIKVPFEFTFHPVQFFSFALCRTRDLFNRDLRGAFERDGDERDPRRRIFRRASDRYALWISSGGLAAYFHGWHFGGSARDYGEFYRGHRGFHDSFPFFGRKKRSLN